MIACAVFLPILGICNNPFKSEVLIEIKFTELSLDFVGIVNTSLSCKIVSRFKLDISAFSFKPAFDNSSCIVAYGSREITPCLNTAP